MKKIITLATLAAIAATAWAAESAMFNFAQNGAALLGLTAPSSSSSNAGDITAAKTATVDGVTFTVSPSTTNMTNRLYSDYYGNVQLRVYSGTITIAAPAGKSVTGVTFYNSKWSEPEASSGTFTGNKWAGSASPVVYTVGAQMRLDSVLVTYGEGGGTQPDTTATGVTLATLKMLRDTIADGTQFTFTGEAIVCYQWGEYLYLRCYDPSDYYGYSALVHGNVGLGYKQGDIVPAGWKGTKTTTMGMCEIIEPTGFTVATQQADSTDSAPFDMSGYLGVFIDAPQGYEGDYDYFKNVTVSSADSKGNFTITEHGVNADMQEGTFTMPCYNKFGIDLPTDTTQHYSVEGVLHIYNDKAQFQPTKFTAYDWSTRLWKVWYQGQDSTRYQLADTLYVIPTPAAIEPEVASKNLVYLTDNATMVLIDLYADWGYTWWQVWDPDFIAIDCGNDTQLYNKLSAMKAIAPRSVEGTLYSNLTNPRLVLDKAPQELAGVEMPDIAYMHYNLAAPDSLSANGNQVAWLKGFYKKDAQGAEYLVGYNQDGSLFQQVRLDRRYLGSTAVFTEGKEYNMRAVFKQLEPWEQPSGVGTPALTTAATPRQRTAQAASQAPAMMPARIARKMPTNDPHWYQNYIACPVEVEAMTGVDGVLNAKTVKRVSYYNVAGIETSQPQPGLNIVVTTYTDGTTHAAKLLK